MMNSRRRRSAPRGARLVALLDREVVEKLRKLPVARDLLRVEGDGLLVGHREDVLPASAILEPEKLLDVVALRVASQSSIGVSTGMSIS